MGDQNFGSEWWEKNHPWGDKQVKLDLKKYKIKPEWFLHPFWFFPQKNIALENLASPLLTAWLNGWTQGNPYTRGRGWYRMCSHQPSVCLVVNNLEKYFPMHKQPILQMVDDCTSGIVYPSPCIKISLDEPVSVLKIKFVAKQKREKLSCKINNK